MFKFKIKIINWSVEGRSTMRSMYDFYIIMDIFGNQYFS